MRDAAGKEKSTFTAGDVVVYKYCPGESLVVSIEGDRVFIRVIGMIFCVRPENLTHADRTDNHH